MFVCFLLRYMSFYTIILQIKMKLIYSFFFVCSFEVPVINHESNSFWLLFPLFFLHVGASFKQNCRKSCISTLIFFMYYLVSLTISLNQYVYRQNEYVKESFLLPWKPFFKNNITWQKYNINTVRTCVSIILH